MKGLIGNSLFAACCIATAVFTGCGNDSTSNANVTDNPTNTKSGTLPDTVASFNDLQMQYNRVINAEDFMLAGHAVLLALQWL